MTKVTKKLLLSVFSVVLTIIALGATTFAWFTITNVASVQAFDADFKANQGIEIALGNRGSNGFDDLNWVTNLTNQMIASYITLTHLSEGQTSFEFDHVTSVDGVSFRKINESYGFTNLTNVAGAGYIELPLHFRSNSAEAIELSSLNYTTPQKTWKVDVPFNSGLDALGDPIESKTGDLIAVFGHNAIRIGFTAEEHVDLLTDPVLRKTIFEKGDVTSPLHLGAGGTFNLTTHAGAMSYFLAKNSTLPVGSDAVVLPQTNVELNDLNRTVLNMFGYYVADGEGNMVLVDAAQNPGANFYGKVILRIWVEGWDADAYNAILGSILTVSMTFTGKL